VRRVLLVLFVTSASAGATPLVDGHLGGGVFVGPTDPGVAAVFWNPAAIGLSRGFHALVVAEATLDATSIDRTPIDPATGKPTAGGSRGFAPLSSLRVMPGGIIGFTSALTHEITLGLAVSTPYAQRMPTGDAIRYHAQDGYFLIQENTVAVAYTFEDRVIGGIGVNFDLPYYDLRFARDTNLDSCKPMQAGGCDIEDPAAAENIRLVSQLAASFSLTIGLAFRITDWLFGASYHSAPITWGNSGISQDASATVQPPGSAPLAGFAHVGWHAPAFLNVGARRPIITGWDLVLGIRWVNLAPAQYMDLRLNGSALQAASVPEWITRYQGLQDVWSFEAGIERQPRNNKLRLGARLRFETSGVPTDAIAPEQIDAPKFDLSVGASFKLSTHWRLNAGYSLSLLLPQTVTTSVFSPATRLDCVASNYDLDTCHDTAIGQGVPTAAGSYSQSAHEFFLGVAYDVW
jgi:long-subunit fatty acid transport protein